jgi:hypothetical protein
VLAALSAPEPFSENVHVARLRTYLDRHKKGRRGLNDVMSYCNCLFTEDCLATLPRSWIAMYDSWRSYRK